jgi:NAD(P)-dependent dehydrogenase (short-subunit alcohol dehydrogenase family)
MFDLSGKVAIVTGSTRGLGRAIAQGFACAGATVVISSRKADLCNDVAAEIQNATGSKAIGVACHVGDWETVPKFVEQVVDALGRIDVLVNNAGINPALQTVGTVDLNLWRKIFNVNLEGALRMSQCVAPVMRDGDGGSIINIGTMEAYAATPISIAYGASKAALRHLTMSMANEWAPWGIRVNILSPGPFETDMITAAESQHPGTLTMLAEMTAQKRVANVNEIIGPALYLASRASSFVTGDDLTVNGGMRK